MKMEVRILFHTIVTYILRIFLYDRSPKILSSCMNILSWSIASSLSQISLSWYQKLRDSIFLQSLLAIFFSIFFILYDFFLLFCIAMAAQPKSGSSDKPRFLTIRPKESSDFVSKKLVQTSRIKGGCVLNRSVFSS